MQKAAFRIPTFFQNGMPSSIRHNGSCSKDFAKLLQNNLYSDVTLLVNSTRFPAHKAILAIRSDYFNTLFSSGLSESQKCEIKIEESNTNLFGKLLGYIYTGEMSIQTETEAVEMLVMANKYFFTDLQSDIAKHLKAKLTPKNFCQIYSAAYHCSIQSLKDECLKFSYSKCEEILKSEGFTKLHVDAIGEIVSCPGFKPEHTHLFNAVLEWIQVNGQSEWYNAEPMLSKIRLCDLPVGFLVTTVRQSGLFIESDILDAIASAHGPMKITVDLSRLGLSLTSLTLEVNSSDTVASMRDKLKTHLLRYNRYDLGNSRLSFNGTPLNNERSLADYGIKSGSTLCIVHKQLAGSSLFLVHKPASNGISRELMDFSDYDYYD